MVDGLPDRRTVENALRAAGLTHRQARKFISVGWKSLVGEIQAENAELQDKLAELVERLKPTDG